VVLGRSFTGIFTCLAPPWSAPIAAPDGWESDGKVAAEAKTYWRSACVGFVHSCPTLWQDPDPQANPFLSLNPQTVCCSTDAGATWANLTTGSGPHEVAWTRVHPVTREAWLNGQCYGNWKIAPQTNALMALLAIRQTLAVDERDTRN